MVMLVSAIFVDKITCEEILRKITLQKISRHYKLERVALYICNK